MIPRRRFLQLLDRMEAATAAAFLRSVSAIRGRARIDALEAAVAAGDVEAALLAAGVLPGSFDQVGEAVRNSYREAGMAAAATIPSSVGILFDINADSARRWLAGRPLDLIREIMDSQRELVRLVIARGLEQGRNPRSTALDLVGRMASRGAPRRGGLVGLTDAQYGWVRNMVDELSSGEPVAMSRYFGRQRRDRRFDGVVSRAIRAGRPVAFADIQRISSRYSDRLLQMRGEAIARTETLRAMSAAQQEMVDQAVKAGKLKPPTKRWRSASDSRVRESHAALEGTAVPNDEPFISPLGSRLMYPGDRSLGALAEDVIQCRCSVTYEVDWI